MPSELERLAQEVAKLLRHDDGLMNSDDVAEFFRISKEQFRKTWKTHPKFPKEIRVPTAQGRGHPLWWKSEIYEYAEQCKQL